jgi:hypothetical protein
VQSGGAPLSDASLRLYVGNPAGPENTWSVVGTAQTDAAGAFKFSFVTRSAYWTQLPAHANSTYIVAVDPPSGLGAGRALVPNVTVTAGAETELGAIALP